MAAVALEAMDRGNGERPELGPDLARSLLHLLDSARRSLDADPGAADASIARASALLKIEIDRSAVGGGEGIAPGSLAGWQVHRVKAYVDAHLETPIHIQDLAKVAQRSGAYFCRAFKRTFGETPHGFILDRRLRRANELMLTSDASLSEIAASCGFSDQAHLSKVFRTRHGQSPAAWRRERRDFTAPGGATCSTLLRPDRRLTAGLSHLSAGSCDRATPSSDFVGFRSSVADASS
jgi:AraC family transcriptional regulator